MNRAVSRPRDRTLPALVGPTLALAALAATAWAQVPASSPQDAPPPVVRILQPPGAVAGNTRIEVLIIDPAVHELVFAVDGVEQERRRRPPWEVKLKLADPGREQTVRVVALGARDVELGADEMVVNRVDPRLRVRIAAIDGEASSGEVTVHAEVSVPRKAHLERVIFFRNQAEVARREAPPYSAAVPLPAPSPDDFVRVVAELADGRTVEDVHVLAAPGLSERLDVNLVQLQTLVTTKRGAPVRDLGRDDFEVRQGGRPQTVDRLYLAQDLSLVLGLVLDASGSMEAVWDLAQRAARRFLDATLGGRDRAFLIDFDTQLRLAQPLTADRAALDTALSAIEPAGGTALFDSILYGLLQYADEPGRRALVVLTDGIDAGSSADPERIVELAGKLGVPVYVVALPVRGALAGGFQPAVTDIVHLLKLITDPSGGRLIRTRGVEGLERAFAQIVAELRGQYVLTYYADEPPGEGRQGVEVRVKGRKDLQVRSVLPLDLVQ